MLFILFTLFIASSIASYGVDLANAVSVDTLVCLCQLGFANFFIFRAYQSLGQFDPNAYQNYLNAKETGWTTKNLYSYFYPCLSCGDPEGQVADYWNNIQANGMELGRTFFDIEGNWYDSASNKAFFESLINKQRALGFAVGIYSSYYQWESIFGLDYTFKYASEYPLWYAHYDSWDSFGDFDAFAGWSYPYMKQYNGDMWTCNFDVDYNYRED